uniref:Uncharacterized protein n=1 Tax=Strongyloides papillosus TaxID=174720 RepID=A0A0N5BEP5_STREA
MPRSPVRACGRACDCRSYGPRFNPGCPLHLLFFST